MAYFYRYLMTLRRQTLVHFLHKFKCVATRSLSSKSTSMSGGNVHKTAQEGFKQGDHYDKSRPSYSDELVTHVVSSLHKGDYKDTQYDIVELGAGTGLFTRKIMEKFKDMPKIRYLATEPSDEFLSVLKQRSPSVDTLICSATKLPFPENSVQNIICAQCFHWFANKESLTEIHRVLVPGGRLCKYRLFLPKHFFKKMNDAGEKLVEGVLTLYYDDTPRKINETWKNVFDNCSLFRCVERRYLAGIDGMKGDKDFVLNHFTSISVIARLDPRRKEEAVQKFRAVLDETFTDDVEINIPFKSDFYCTEKVIQ
ncbi:uncharacterized protein LOC132716226 [Ruditapes philippinarum]|uniref:uncharacterized protein LOC132716226 n=1 Tax=Ruditapes philippinarum TaxID=129788 RepID=UPI00295B1CE9|nr:uncharacterized protein LOC132716226 [Ruditapes philippinarum]